MDLGAKDLYEGAVWALKDKEGKELIGFANQKETTWTWGAAFWIEKGFRPERLSDMLWNALGAPIAVLGDTEGNDLGAENFSTAPYVGKHSLSEFNDAVLAYQGRGISRAYNLLGPPGTGKSAFALAWARDHGHRVIKLLPSAWDFTSRLTSMTDILRPGLLLIEDADHASDYRNAMLDALTAIRLRHPGLVVVCTANSVSEQTAALLRPGRMGLVLEFLAPSPEEKHQLLDIYFRRYGVDPTAYDFRRLVALMDHPRFTHDYVRSTAEEAVCLNQTRLEAYVKNTVRFLETVGETHVKPQTLKG